MAAPFARVRFEEPWVKLEPLWSSSVVASGWGRRIDDYRSCFGVVVVLLVDDRELHLKRARFCKVSRGSWLRWWCCRMKMLLHSAAVF
jgi:hypothetical protein